MKKQKELDNIKVCRLAEIDKVNDKGFNYTFNKYIVVRTKEDKCQDILTKVVYPYKSVHNSRFTDRRQYDVKKEEEGNYVALEDEEVTCLFYIKYLNNKGIKNKLLTVMPKTKVKKIAKEIDNQLNKYD